VRCGVATPGTTIHVIITCPECEDWRTLSLWFT